jgi:hypothetical protein
MNVSVFTAYSFPSDQMLKSKRYVELPKSNNLLVVFELVENVYQYLRNKD